MVCFTLVLYKQHRPDAFSAMGNCFGLDRSRVSLFPWVEFPCSRMFQQAIQWIYACHLVYVQACVACLWTQLFSETNSRFLKPQFISHPPSNGCKPNQHTCIGVIIHFLQIHSLHPNTSADPCFVPRHKGPLHFCCHDWDLHPQDPAQKHQTSNDCVTPDCHNYGCSCFRLFVVGCGMKEIKITCLSCVW